MTFSLAYIRLLAAVGTTYVRQLSSSDGLERIGLLFKQGAMALFSGQRLNRLVVVHLVVLVAGFPACGAAGGKADVLEEINGHLVRRHLAFLDYVNFDLAIEPADPELLPYYSNDYTVKPCPLKRGGN